MYKFKKFYISFILFISLFLLFDVTGIGIGTLSTENLKVLLLFIFAIYMWIAQVLPNSYISVLVIVLIGVLKFDSFTKVVSYTFGNTVFIFLFSIFIVSYAFKKSGLADRISRTLFSRCGGSTRRILFSLMLTSYILGMLLTAIAGVSISLPIALRVIELNRLKKGDRLAKACMLGITYAGLIGGVATPLGTPVNLLMLQYIRELGNYNLTFINWVLIGVPLSMLLLACCFFLLVGMLKLKNSAVTCMEVKREPLLPEEKLSAAAFLIIISLFLLSQFFEMYVKYFSLNLNTISVICCLLLVLPPFRVIEWKDAMRNLDWESLFFLTGSIALGYLLYNTGTAAEIAGMFFSMTGSLNLYLYVFILCAFTVVMHMMLSSNTVTGTVIIPILLSLARQIGASSWYVAAPAVFCISLAFILPTESPTNIITYNTGHFELRDMISIGAVLSVISIVVISLFLILYGKATGLYTVG